MNPRTLSALALTSVGLTVAACGTGPIDVDPGPVEGEYHAESANNNALPAFINASGSSQSGRRLESASLTLRGPNSLMLVMNTELVDASGTVQGVESDTVRAHYHVQGSRLILSRMAPYPLLLAEEASLGSKGSVTVTRNLPLPPSAGFFGTYPVEIFFRR